MESAIKKLEKDIGKKTDRFNDGDVIRWISKANDGREFTYVVVKAGGRYWITGTALWYGKQIFSYDEVVKILARDDVIEVEVAIAWAEVKV
jgi:hypothetical protein